MPKKIILPKKKGVGNQLSLFAEDNELLLRRKKKQIISKKISDQRFSFKKNITTYVQENKHSNYEFLKKNYSDFNLKIIDSSHSYLDTHDKLLLTDKVFIEKKIAENPSSKYLPGIRTFLITLRREGGKIIDLLVELKNELKLKEQLRISKLSHTYDSSETRDYNEIINNEEDKINKLKEEILSLHSDYYTKKQFYFAKIRKSKTV